MADRESTTAACMKYEALLEDYLNGDLSESLARDAAEHWRDCTACSEALEQAQASLRLIRFAAQPSGEPGPAFARTVMARIREASGERSAERGFWQPFVSLAWRFAATATLAVAVLVTYDAGWGHRIPANPVGQAAARITDIFSPDPANNPPANSDEVLMMVAETSHGK